MIVCKREEKSVAKSALVSCEWLKQHLYDENLAILDATFFLPRQQRNAEHEYQNHIPGAVFFDIDRVADRSKPLPHTLPTPEQFSEEVGLMGIDNNTQVVIYDHNHFFAAARVWWMFRVFGHENVRVLDGGMTRWGLLNYPIGSESVNPIRKVFSAQYREDLVFDLKQMMAVQKSGARQIVDARSADSFWGRRPQTEKSIKAGHIPNSVNLPYALLTDDQQQTLLANEKLQALFAERDIDLATAIVTTCGSGVSAAVIVLALYQLGRSDITLYDGSWAEWSRHPDTTK